MRSLVSAMRPQQWVKNGLLVIAPAAAGVLSHADVLRHTVVAFLSFCALSSATYLLNDVRDVDADRQHPVKRHRAIAAGQLGVPVAVAVAVVLAVAGFVVPLFLWHPWGLELVLALYFVNTQAYIFSLKNLAVVELGSVAAGFFLRAYAGAVASHIFVSEWFLVVISFGAGTQLPRPQIVGLVVGKRSSELKNLGAGATRKVLQEYTSEFLDSALTMTATVTVAGYCLWGFDTSATGLSSIHHNIIPIRLSVIPVVLAILFIMREAEAGGGSAPEELILKNRTVQLLLVLWAILIAIGIYA